MIPEIAAKTQNKVTQTYAQKLLVELCQINTTPSADVSIMRDAENRCLEVLERELKKLSFANGRLERRSINPNIKSHPNYSLPHFTKTKQRPAGLSAEETYAGRSNLVYVAPGTNAKDRGISVALNAHIDVVAPYFPPRLKNGIVFGRGACDDKGPVVAMLIALKILSEIG